MRSLAHWSRLGLIALSACALGAGTLAHADTPAPGAVPPGWVWQGTWQNGQWNGQWIPGPGVQPGQQQWGNDPALREMLDRCRDDHARDHDCAVFFAHHPEFTINYPGYPIAPPPYYGMQTYAPMLYAMVPMITTAQRPGVETRTVTTTTEYVVHRRERVIWVKPHHKDKRVYTGS